MIMEARIVQQINEESRSIHGLNGNFEVEREGIHPTPRPHEGSRDSPTMEETEAHRPLHRLLPLVHLFPLIDVKGKEIINLQGLGGLLEVNRLSVLSSQADWTLRPRLVLSL